MMDAVLSTKRAVLSSGGVSYNDLYYGTMNSSLSLLECTFNYNYSITLPSRDFGSTSQINIPNDQLFECLILHLVLPQVVQGQSLARTWGYGMLNSVAWTFGSSNSTQIMLQGDSIYQTVIGQCTDPLKRLEISRLAGEEQTTPPPAPDPDSDIPLNEAYLLIPLPCSTLCDKLPVDTTMLQNNISVQIQFNSDPRLIYGGTPTPPTSFLLAEVILKQGKLSNQAMSARKEMIMQPNLKYSYPFIHSQNFITPDFPGSRISNGARVSLTLNTFLNADIVGIMFWVVANENKRPTNNSTPNPYNLDPISNVRLLFAGQTLFDFPGQSYKLTNMLSGQEQSASYIPGSYIPPGLGPFLPESRDNYPIFFDFSRIRSICFHSHLFNTWRLTNQNLILEFNTKYGNSVIYRAYCTYFYNGVVQFSNGTSAIFID